MQVPGFLHIDHRNLHTAGSDAEVVIFKAHPEVAGSAERQCDDTVLVIVFRQGGRGDVGIRGVHTHPSRDVRVNLSEFLGQVIHFEV